MIFNIILQLTSCTKRQIETHSEVWKLFSQSSTGVPALLPCAMMPKQIRGTSKEQISKPAAHFAVHFVS